MKEVEQLDADGTVKIMAYIQNNNPFKRSIKEMTDKEYDAMCDNLKGGPGSDPAEEAAKAQGREKGEMNKSSQFHPDNQGPRHKSGLFYKSGLKKRGLWDNIHAKRKRIKAGSGETMRKPGEKGAPSAKDLKDSQTKK